MLNNQFTYKRLFRFILILFISFLLKFSLLNCSVLVVPFFISLLYLGFPIIDCALAFFIPFLITLDLHLIIPSLVIALSLSLVFLIYRKKNKLVKSELIAYSLLACTLFIFLTHKGELLHKVIYLSISSVLTFVFISSSRIIFIKKFNYKLLGDEIACLSLFSLPLFLGIINLFNVETAKAISIFIILLTSNLFGGGISVACSVVLSIAPTIVTESLNYTAVYAIFGLASLLFRKNYQLFSAFLLLGIDLIFMIVLKIYGPFDIYSIIYSVVAVIVYLFLPSSILDDVKSKINNLSSKLLPKYAINRLRLSVADKLHNVSSVFYQIEDSFKKLKSSVSSSPELLSKMADEIIIRVCESCPKYNVCKQHNLPHHAELVKILSIGIAKNKVSLIDLTNDFIKKCSYANSVLFEMNKLLGEYNQKIKELEDVSQGKELICLQAQGIATLLKKMAVDYSTITQFSSEIERKLAVELRRNNLPFNELYVLKNGDDIEINVVCNTSVLLKPNFLKTISKVTKEPMSITSKTNISMELSAITIKNAPLKDACFGVASKVKNNQNLSGDTHSLSKLNESKFLIALSDGMGSGIRAENTSKTAISLIESFYKAGLDSDLILNIVNKVLTINTDDNFSAIDIVVVNLHSMIADFIKIGAPYSFILSDESVKIIEGSSLPLGILDDLSPSGCRANLKDGDTIITFTDGISDAFTSSTDLIDFIRTLDNKNPQLIADSILNKALELDGNIPKDDMTVLAVRIFSKTSHIDLE